MIPGYNATAVQRREDQVGEFADPLARFGFHGDKVSRIIEYGK